ncbi:MAG: hypothetical protein DMG77_06980 [Acidobacteria bacterium]|nr:MAG: hypothetical protein DMG77_06980 [Acidobacteriota bacterium]
MPVAGSAAVPAAVRRASSPAAAGSNEEIGDFISAFGAEGGTPLRQAQGRLSRQPAGCRRYELRFAC